MYHLILFFLNIFFILFIFFYALIFRDESQLNWQALVQDKCQIFTDGE